jgi:hypothetical protein
MKESSYTLAAEAVHRLHRKARANGQTNTAIAKALDISRPTLADHYATGKMQLSEFLELAKLVGEKPGDVLHFLDVNSNHSSMHSRRSRSHE